MSNGVYIKHRYGRHGGTVKVEGKGGSTIRDTGAAMMDKCRYNETRFAGESNTIYAETGENLQGYKAAYERTAQAADRLAAANSQTRNRNKGRAYIYDTTINPGSGRLADEAAHQLAREFLTDLQERGYAIDGYQYTIHQGTQHTHIHAMYATGKTLQLRDIRPMSGRLRTLAQTLEQRRDLEQRQEQQQRHEQAQVQTYTQEIKR